MLRFRDRDGKRWALQQAANGSLVECEDELPRKQSNVYACRQDGVHSARQTFGSPKWEVCRSCRTVVEYNHLCKR